MKLSIGNYQFIARRLRPEPKKKAVYCRSYEEFGAAVRAAGIDIWQTWSGFRSDCDAAGIEVDNEADVYFTRGLNILRAAELDAGKADENDNQSMQYLGEDENDEAVLRMLGQAHFGPSTKVILPSGKQIPGSEIC